MRPSNRTSPIRTAPVRAAALVALVALAGGCGDDGGTADTDAGDRPDAADLPDAPSALCTEATMHSDLQWIQDNVFTPSCAAFAACHRGPAIQAQGLNLEAGSAEADLVDHPSGRFTDRILVVPGDPEASYLMVALGTYTGPLSDTGVMPPMFGPLCVEIRDAVERWITSLGAARDNP